MECYLILIFVLVGVAVATSPCTTNYGKIPHPNECQLYYDCSQPGTAEFRTFEHNLYECEYPNVYNAELEECGDYHDTDCGSRNVVKDICQTMKYKFAGAQGRPCEIDHLNCDGLPDGRHAMYRENLEATPYYAECLDGRFVGKRTCKNNELYNPETKECQ